MTLRRKMMLILSLSLLVSLGGSGLFFKYQHEQAFRSAALKSVESAAHANANYLANFLDVQKALANHLKHYFPMDAFLAGDYDRIRGFLAEHANDLPFFSNGFFFLDNEGYLRADYPRHQHLEGENFSYRDYFQKTMSQKQNIVAQPYQSARTGAKVLTFTAYLQTDDGQPVGMIGVSVDLANDIRLSELRLQKHGRTGYNYVFDRSRMLVLHPNLDRMLQRDVPVGANKGFDAAIEGIYGAAETVNSRGIAMLTAFFPVQGSDWILASQLPVDEALATLAESKRTLLWVGMLVIVTTVVLGTYLVHRNMFQLERLEGLVGTLKLPGTDEQAKDLDVDVETKKLQPFTGHPEFGPLAEKVGKLYQSLGGAWADTQQKQLALNDAYQQLKKTQAQILHQEKMASIGQIAAGVAHEINNPMGFIGSNLRSLNRYFERLVLYLQEIEDCSKSTVDNSCNEKLLQYRKKYKIAFLLEDVPDLIEESLSGADRVKEIVQNLKSFSRIDQAELSEADINECLESTILIAWNEIKYKAELAREFAELPKLTCNAQQLNQVFLNILINAVQAIKANGKIIVKTYLENDSIHVAISDNGCGIAEEKQSKIFEPFFTTKDAGEGTGLGMSISYDIVKQHHGDILLESVEGEGTTFTIVLPLNGKETARA